jgi:hypothetical protein
MKKLTLCLLLIVGGGVAWRTIRNDAPEAKLLFDRLWVDHEPRGDADTFQAMWVDGGRPFGNFTTRTIWTGQWEGFHYHLVPREDGVVDFLFGTTKERQRVRYTARACNEKGFDLCLELSGTSRGLRHYYSKKAWQIKAGELDRADDLMRALVNNQR